MILRRLTEHVRTQNWFAVGLDFFIVVVGVFLGIQLGNWNEARALRAQEQSYLAVLHEELVENASRSARLLTYYTTVTEAAERALAFTKSGQNCGTDCEDLLIDFFHASQLWTVTFDQTAFREAVALGFPSDQELREQLFVTYDLTTSFGVINQDPPAVRETIREYLEPDAARILWQGCWRLDVDTVTEHLIRGCKDELKSVDTAGILKALQDDPQLASMLRFWLSQNILAIQNYPVVRDRTMRTAEMVAARIEAVR
ncbi:hypothetical protein HK107_01450 [Parvularcula sp. ZS-1/3]|uniref:Uncharacterized protein n=1 Tax=Parvularcula mediterranea TaxID=2732508 RepID=A0A7Y3RJ30_9PROT|nr:hypothetical protein [Parvularcula mediterranea]NNU14988.1 hypothetical protein [Parvularcula mediterranea]